MSFTKLPPLPPSLATFPQSTKEAKTYVGLTGGSYNIQSNKYSLPPSAVLQPYVDTKSGTLDTWPAHALGPQPSNFTLTIKQSNEFMPKGFHKPKFLEQLEAFLQKELRSLDCMEIIPSEKRLQIFREVFEYLIEDFKTYKPLLAAIKHEYEIMLVHQREKIRELEPLKSMLVTVSEQCEKKVLSLREEEKSELKDSRKENERLQQVIQKMRDDHVSLQIQVKKLQEELAAEYLRYRNECDARKMLIADINDLKYQQEDSKKSGAGDQEETKEDVTMLRMALRKAREDLEAKNNKLARMEADYGDVVPRRDFERLEAQFQNLQKQMATTKADHDKLMMEHNALLEVHEKVVEQRNNFAHNAEQLRRSATPRPHWDKCAQHVEGGPERWAQISQGKTSEELVDVLLAELTGSDIAVIQSGASTGMEFFEGQGTGPEVPKYLRADGQVRNRRLGKRDTSLLIKDIWNMKAAHDAERQDGSHEDLAEFLYLYLQRRFSVEPMVIEWGYNLHDACNRYSHDDRIGLFFAILSGTMDEKVYLDQLGLFQALLSELKKQDFASGNQGSLPKAKFDSTLKEFFSLKEAEAMEELLKAAVEEVPGDPVKYKEFFTEDEEGKTGPFIDKIREQDKVEREAYVKEIEKQVITKSEVLIDEARQAFKTVDPEITDEMLNKYLSRGFGDRPIEELVNVKVVTVDFIRQLQTGSVRRVGKKP